MQLANLRHGGAFHSARRTNKRLAGRDAARNKSGHETGTALVGIIPFQRFKCQRI